MTVKISIAMSMHIRKKIICKFVARLALGLVMAIPAGASAAGLREIYELAKAYDAELKAAEYDFAALSQSVPLARSSLRPQLNSGFSYGLNDASPDASGSYQQQRLTLQLSQTLFNYADMLAVDQSKLALNQAEAELEAQRQALIMRVSSAYFSVLRSQAVLLFRRSELDAIGRQKEQNERRFEVGLVPVTDVKNAQAQYDLATAQEIAAANALSTAQEALIVISGADPEGLAELRDDAPLVSPSPADIDAWVRTAENQNIPLIIARLAAENAKTQIKADRALRYPTLDLVGVGSMNQTGQDGRPDSDSGEIRLEFNLPLLSGGRTSALIRQSHYESLSANQRLTAQRRATVQTTRDSYRGVVADISRTQALRQALISTQKSLEAQEAGFAEGLLTSLEVLRSLRDTFQAQSDYSSSRYDYILNSLNLKQASGVLSEKDLTEVDSWLNKL